MLLVLVKRFLTKSAVVWQGGLALPRKHALGLSKIIAGSLGVLTVQGKRLEAIVDSFRCGQDNEHLRAAFVFELFSVYKIAFPEEDTSEMLRKLHLHFEIPLAVQNDHLPNPVVAVVSAPCQEIAALKAQITRLRKSVVKAQRLSECRRLPARYWKQKSSRLTVQNHTLKQKLLVYELGVPRGKARRYFSSRRGISTALKQCISNTASYSAGLLMEESISGKTLCEGKSR